MIGAGARGYLTAAHSRQPRDVRPRAAAVRDAVLGATLAVPDGQPLVWALRALGTGAPRACGPELMSRFCARAARSGTPIYRTGPHAAGATRAAGAPPSGALPGLQIAGATRRRSAG
jgi:N-acetylglucosaminyldiphosphoundecaprenol N-acetyl-beta-D-mannosaminyltransferase